MNFLKLVQLLLLFYFCFCFFIHLENKDDERIKNIDITTNKMNTEICAKCQHDIQITETEQGYTLACFFNSSTCFIKFLLKNELPDLLSKSEIRATKIDLDSEYKFRNYYWIRPTKKIDCLINQEISKSCPYYVEHQLNDWNCISKGVYDK